MSENHIEPVNRGLMSALDPINMPEGGLTLAQNAYYKPRNATLWHAPGRVKVDGQDDGGYATPGSRQLAVVVPDNPTFKPRLLMKTGTDYSLIEAQSTPSEFQDDTALILADKPGGNLPLDTAQVKGELFVTAGGRAISLGAPPFGGFNTREHGMPFSDNLLVGLINLPTHGSVTPYTIPQGVYWYFATWVRITTFNDATSQVLDESATTDSGVFSLSVEPTDASGVIRVSFSKAFVDAKPAAANALRIYRSVAQQTTSPVPPTASPLLVNPWPALFHVGTITPYTVIGGEIWDPAGSVNPSSPTFGLVMSVS